MIRPFAGICLGILAGVVAVFLVESVSVSIYPPPADLEVSNREAMLEYIKGLPLGAFLMVLLAHAFGAFAAAFVCEVIVRNRWITGWLALGFLFLVGGIANLLLVPHPTWFGLVDLLLYLPAAYSGGKTAASLFSSAAKQPIVSEA